MEIVLERDVTVGTLPAGKYYIGDPCYVIDERLWSDFCNVTMRGDEDIAMNGCIIDFQGHKCFVCATNSGDGTYTDQMQREYDVDSGLIGAIPMALVIRKGWETCGHTFITPDEFSVGADKGRWRDLKCIYISAVRICT